MRWATMIAVGFMIACGDNTATDAGIVSDVPTGDARTDATNLSDAGSPTDDAGSPSVILGLGVVDFTPANDGDDAELVAGPQGGWHVDVALQLFNVEPDGSLLTLQGFDADSGDALSVPIARRLTRTRVRRVSDYWLRLGDQMVFNVADPLEVTGRDVRITATLEEADGRVSSGALRVHIVDDVE